MLNGKHYLIETLVKAKGTGASTKIKKELLIVNDQTASSDQIHDAVVYPFDNKFIVLVQPITGLKEFQNCFVMSKFYLKSIAVERKYVSNPLQFDAPPRRYDNYNQRPREYRPRVENYFESEEDSYSDTRNRR